VEDNKPEIRISAKNIELTQLLKDIVTKKFGDINRFFSALKVIEVYLKSENRLHYCEVILIIKGKEDVVIDVAREEIVEAIDVAVNKCERQLRRLKEKTIDQSRDVKRKKDN